ncbi:AEC family transporter [Sphingobacterium rhinopitheci]|uniref:AEC family transporter n=1 Tax=Sphingobacterium rhinopitheci TaxID=2781960 RepID=UPI001F52951D|nr:AEC family transporter [Sphingobacterium rhinopitheci]MCI0921306.1 AEC family transporter [Sphingobacterium rhinopitheci]
MSNFLIIVFCLIIGYLFRFFNLAGKNDYKIVNTWVIYIGLPSIALLYIPRIDWSLAYLFTAFLPFLVFGLSYLFFNILNRWLDYSKRTVTTLAIVSGLSNTSFVGFPLIISYFGEEQLKVGIVSDQVTFFTLSTLGVLLAAGSKSIFPSQKEKMSFILKRLFTFPPFLACLFALLFGRFFVNDDISSFFQALAATVSPLALFSIGMQLQFRNLKKEINTIGLSLFYKLILAPLIAVLLALLLGLKGIFYQVSVFEMAMPCLVASSMIIEKFGLNVKLSNTIIGLSIVVGLAISFLWYCVIITLL